MTRAATEPPKPADPDEVRLQLAGKHVCPFCGVPRADAAQPCPRCTLDDSSATRQATRQRVGPWFVLQARNPSAPGMKFATLQSLARRGHVTPRSVVRGPTTEQFWGFAATVRGLSREFGLCHHCGEPVDPAAAKCTHCGRGQEVVGDPDALLEGATPAAIAPVLTPFTPAAPPSQPELLAIVPPPADTGMSGGVSLDLQADPLPARPRAPVRAAPPAALPAATVQRIALPAKEEAILSARELAAAFQLDFNPPGNRKPRAGARPVRTLLALLVIAAMAGAIVLGLRPDWRRTSLAWVTERWAALTASLDQPAKPQAVATPNKSPVAPTPPPVMPPSLQSSTPAVAPVTPQVPLPPVAPPPRVKVEPPPVVVVPPAALQTPEISPESMTLDQATAAASDLRNRAIDAEARKEWTAAVRLYEQIQRLPRDAWPADLTVKLEIAKKRAGL